MKKSQIRDPKVRKEFLALEKELGRVPEPKDLVQFKTDNPESALAQCFTASADEAAYKWWLEEARTIIAEYRVIESEPVVITRREFEHVPMPQQPARRERRPPRSTIIDTVLRRLLGMVKLYRHLTELQPLFEVLDELADKHLMKKKAG